LSLPRGDSVTLGTGLSGFTVIQPMLTTVWKIFLAGLLLIVPAWATLFILLALFRALDGLVGAYIPYPMPGLGVLLLVLLLLLAGALSTHVLGQHVLERLERRLERIPLVQSIYLTLKGMTDLFHFRSRFGRSTVVAFRDGLWALGFVMGTAPPALQIGAVARLLMVFVPTAIHPFTGYLAFVPEDHVHRLNLLPEDAMKMEFSAGLFKPQRGWLQSPR
jgi:uncharacterized membrane protein